MSKFKIIPFVGDVHCESVDGKKLYLKVAGDVNTATTAIVAGNPLVVTQFEYYLERSNDPKLVAKLDSYEGDRMRFKLRRSLRQQYESGEFTKGWKIEESVYQRFLACITGPEQKLLLEPIKFNFFEFDEAVSDATTVEEEEK